MIQSGTVRVGSQNATTFSKEVQIYFPQSFPTFPTVVVTPLQQPGLPPIPDSFSATVVDITPQGAVVRIHRVDVAPPETGGWAQDLQLGWIANVF